MYEIRATVQRRKVDPWRKSQRRSAIKFTLPRARAFALSMSLRGGAYLAIEGRDSAIIHKIGRRLAWFDRNCRRPRLLRRSRDLKIGAFDKYTGRELWACKLPFGGVAPPSLYQANGREYVMIAARGGGKLGGELGDAYMAFSLEQGRSGSLISTLPAGVAGVLTTAGSTN